MGTVHRTGTGCETVSPGQAVVAYLAELAGECRTCREPRTVSPKLRGRGGRALVG